MVFYGDLFYGYLWVFHTKLGNQADAAHYASHTGNPNQTNRPWLYESLIHGL